MNRARWFRLVGAAILVTLSLVVRAQAIDCWKCKIYWTDATRTFMADEICINVCEGGSCCTNECVHTSWWDNVEDEGC